MLTQKIIDEHKGEITAESKVGVGSTFVIRIPNPDKPKIPKHRYQIPNKSQ